MHATHPVGYLRFLISIAALGLLAALLLLPAPVRAQDGITPTLVVATVDGTSLKLIYSEALDTGSVPAASAYSVVVGSATGVPPSSVAVSGAKVTLTLSTGAASGDTVTVTYTKPGTNPLQDLASNDAAALSAQAVANNTGSTNNQPVFPTAPTTRSVAENTVTATQFGTAVTATDGDSDTLTYSLPTGFSTFAIGTSTGQLQTLNTLDYESGTTSYLVPVYVRDNLSAAGAVDTAIDDTILVTINVTDVNEAPMITSGANNVTKPEQTLTSEILATYAATDPDNGAVLTWMLSDDDAGDFTIVGGELKFRNEPNFENPADNDNNNIYTVTVNVSDGSLSATQDFTITVTNVNEAPLLTSPPTTKSVPENSTAVHEYAATDVDANTTLSWSLSGADAPKFAISTSGVLTFRNPPDFETPTDTGDTDGDNIYVVTVRVDDNGSPMMNQAQTRRVTVTNVDEAGTASFTGNLSAGSTLTAGLTDPDGSISSKSYRWQRSEAANSGFSNITTNGTSETYVPVAADVSKYLRVIVSYTDGEGSNKSATSASRGTIGASNSAPTFSSMTAMRTLPENSGVGVNVVGGVTAATDSDSDTLTYSLTGTDASKFEVDSNGQIKTKSSGSTQTFNFEDTNNNSFSVTVNVHDGKDAAGGTDTSTIDDTIAVTINLTNVNEAPVLTSPPTTKSVPENSTAVHEYAATDVDADTTLSWSLSGADAPKFAISTSGVLTFKNAPDFETPTDTGDTDGDNIYVVTVRVDDNGSPMKNDVHTLRLMVTDVNEAPTIDSGPAPTTPPSM